MTTVPESPSIQPLDHAECAAWLKAQFAGLGVDATISVAPPLVETVYEQGCFVCPHGTEFWHAPTSEQIAQWARDGVS